MTNKFPWGKVLTHCSYNFDGQVFEVTKFYGHKMDDRGFQIFQDNSKTPELDTSKPLYHCEEISQSTETFFGLLLAWITYKQLGLNQSQLVAGLCRALQIKGD
jgi:hypothetical protein